MSSLARRAIEGALLFGLTTLAAAPRTHAGAAPVSVPFQMIADTRYSGWPGGPLDAVAIRKAGFDRVWQFYSAGNWVAPVIDFQQYDVIAVFQGTFPSGGYDISVVDVVQNGSTLDVYVQNKVPAGSLFVTHVFTSPAQMVRVPKLGLPVVFHHTTVGSVGP